MTAADLSTYPDAIQAQLTGVVELASALLGQHLQGMYLIGDGFSGPDAAETATLRLLVVTVRDLLRDTRLGLVQTCLRHSLQPAALDVLIVRAADFAAAQASVLVQLQFTEAQRPQLERETAGHTWLRWPDGPTGSVDRAALLARLQPGSIPLVGSPLANLLTPVLATTSVEGDSSGTPTEGPSQPSREQQLPLDHAPASERA